MDNIISFTARKESYKHDNCSHNSVIIDEDLWNIECSDCGKLLDPIRYLIKLADKEMGLKYEITRLREEKEKVIKETEKRKQFTCDHCGKISKIVR